MQIMHTITLWVYRLAAQAMLRLPPAGELSEIQIKMQKRTYLIQRLIALLKVPEKHPAISVEEERHVRAHWHWG
jgi:hypothetical protein